MAPSSPAWFHFTKTTKAGKVFVRCKLCGAELTYLNSTSNMINHMSSRHQITVATLHPKGGRRKIPVATDAGAVSGNKRPLEEKETNPDNPPEKMPTSTSTERSSTSSFIVSAETSKSSTSGTIHHMVNNIKSYQHGEYNDVKITNAMLYMICRDNMPLCTTERDGFRRFVHTVAPLYQIPSESTVTRRLHDKYSVLRGVVQTMLGTSDQICLTVDVWTHKSTMRSYLGVTAHIRKGTELTTVELGARQMDERKTSENLRKALRQMCADWHIDYPKIKAVVTDGGANIKKAVRDEFGEAKHITCAAHRLNLIGQKVINGLNVEIPSENSTSLPDLPDNESDIEENEDFDARPDELCLRDLIVKVKKIVRFFKQSETATTKLMDFQRETDKTCLKLIQEVRTRFNSCFDMLDRYLQLAPIVTRVLYEVHREKSSKSPPPEALSPREEDILKEVRDLLAPLERSTRELSAQKTVTLSKVIPVIKMLVKDTVKVQTVTTIGAKLKKDLLAQVKEKFGREEEDSRSTTATLLDPRFKKVGFFKDNSLPIRISRAVMFVGNLVEGKIQESEAAASQMTLPQGGVHQPEKSDDFWGDFDDEVQEHAASVSHTDRPGGIPIQLRMFLDSPPVDRRSNPNPLQTWEALKGEYRHLYEVAMEYLPIPATSVPAECLFSHAGLIANQLRNRITGSHLEMLVFMRSCDLSLWMK